MSAVGRAGSHGRLTEDGWQCDRVAAGRTDEASPGLDGDVGVVFVLLLFVVVTGDGVEVADLGSGKRNERLRSTIRPVGSSTW